MTLQSINPFNGDIIATYPETTPEKREIILDSAKKTQEAWAKTGFEQRAEILSKAAQGLRDNAGEYAEIMALEMGKPLKEGLAEVEKCAWVCEYYAEKGESFLRDEEFEIPGKRALVTYRPLGVILGIMPWNFPFWQVFRFAAPTLMAGNGALLKHASNVSGCAKAIAAVWQAAGLPEGLFGVLLIPGREAEKVIADPRIAAVSLTGSTEAGKKVAATAGLHLKKTLLELGGSDPYVVLKDADLDLAAHQCAVSRMINGGQSCIAAKRLIVEKAVIEPFTAKLLEHLQGFQLGNPLDEGINLGPMARADLRDELHDQVTRSISQGAKVILGGEPSPDIPAGYSATLLTGVKPGMPAFDEELFGPVAAVIEARDEDHAMALANQSPFGLGAAVFTGDQNRGEALAKETLQAGACFVNQFVASDPRLPFGGIKESGYGRELSRLGILEFTNPKTVSMPLKGAS